MNIMYHRTSLTWVQRKVTLEVFQNTMERQFTNSYRRFGAGCSLNFQGSTHLYKDFKTERKRTPWFNINVVVGTSKFALWSFLKLSREILLFTFFFRIFNSRLFGRKLVHVRYFLPLKTFIKILHLENTFILLI
jgi:hypothetical protein